MKKEQTTIESIAHNETIYKMLGEILVKSGLPQIFGIDPCQKLLKDHQENIYMLAGFLKGASEGKVGDPPNIEEWKITGTTLLCDSEPTS